MLRLHTLGRFEPTDDATSGLASPIQPKRLALLAFLAARQGDQVEAERISAELATRRFLNTGYLEGSRMPLWRARIAYGFAAGVRLEEILRQVA